MKKLVAVLSVSVALAAVAPTVAPAKHERKNPAYLGNRAQAEQPPPAHGKR